MALVLTGPRSSIGSPITFMIRPKVSGPTGTVIGAPRFVTDCPRTRPSVASIAIVRTVFCPRCCATSRTRRDPLLSVSRAFKIAGNSPTNSTSTTAPITWLILPPATGAAVLRGVRFAVVFLAAGFLAADFFAGVFAMSNFL